MKGFQWRYLGAIAGLQIPDKQSIRLFFIGLLIILCGIGLVGLAPLNQFVKYILDVFGWTEVLQYKDLVTPGAATACVAAVIGSRLSDSIFIHIRPHRQGYCPNPALGAIPYYLAGALKLTVLFFPGLRSHSTCAAEGFAVGWPSFFIVLPGLKKVRKLAVVQTFRRVEPWPPKTNIPKWAMESNNYSQGQEKV